MACDAHYGQCRAFRHALDQAGIVYCADVGKDERVFLTCPAFGVPPATGPGRAPQIAWILEAASALSVAEVGLLTDTLWQTLRVRPMERGYLEEPFALFVIRGSWFVIRDPSHEPRVASSGPCATAFRCKNG